MIDIIILLDNNLKLAICTGVNINALYHYIEVIVSPTALSTSGNLSCNFGPS